MGEYIGETPVEVAAHPTFAAYSPSDWAMLFISIYGQIDGAHHKTWVLDAVSRILKGTPVIVSQARWSDGQAEYRFRLGEPTAEYLEWKETMLCRDENGEPQYDYDEGIAP